MGKFNKKSSIGKVSVCATTLGFLVLGIILLIIGCKDNVVPWLKTTGIAILVIAVPIILWFAHLYISEKIKEM